MLLGFCRMPLFSRVRHHTMFLIFLCSAERPRVPAFIVEILYRESPSLDVPVFCSVSTRCTDFVESFRIHILVTWSASRVCPPVPLQEDRARLYRCQVFALGSWKSQIAVRGEKPFSSWCGKYYTFLHLKFEVLLVTPSFLRLLGFLPLFLFANAGFEQRILDKFGRVGSGRFLQSSILVQPLLF